MLRALSQRVVVVAALVVGVFALLLAQASGAQAVTTGSLSIVSEPGDHIGGGVDVLYDTPGTLSVSGGLAGLSVEETDSGSSSPTWSLGILPPPGQNLQVGEYDDGLWPSVGPGVTVGSGVGFCTEAFGRFVIKDIQVAFGQATRLWVLFEQHCESPSAPALFGEVRINEPAAGAEIAEPSAIDWPDTSVGSVADSVPVKIVAGAAGAKIASVAIAGADKGDFAIQADACTGMSLSAGGSCQVGVAATPAAVGDRTATLEVKDSGGGVTDVFLALLPVPAISGIAPTVGAAAGGTTVTITGDWFTGATGVKFGAMPAVSFAVDSPTQITAVSPSGTVGLTVDLMVTGPHGTSFGVPADHFEFHGPPTSPTDVRASITGNTATVSFSPPASDGGSPVTGYTITAVPGGRQVSGSGSPLVIGGLSPGRYTFQVTASNALGTSPAITSPPATVIAPSSVQLVAIPPTSFFGTPILVEAQVGSAFAGTPTGSVDLRDDLGDFGPAPLGPLGPTTAGLLGVLPVGDIVTASYSGDSVFAPSSATFTPDIRPAVTAMTLTSSANPATAGTYVRVTATVSNQSSAIPVVGSVQFTANGVPVEGGPAELDANGQAAMFWSSVGSGQYTVVASYHDNADVPADYVDSQAQLVESVPAPPTPPVPPSTPVPPATPQVPPPTVTTTSTTTTPSAPTPVPVTSTSSTKQTTGEVVLGKPIVSRMGRVQLAVRAPQAGIIKFVARVVGSRSRHPYASGSLRSNGTRPATLVLASSSAARSALSHHQRLRIRIQVTYVPAAGGKSLTASLVVSI